MPIRKEDLEKMKDLHGKGRAFAQIAKQFPKYDYWEIYWKVNDASFMGRKRAISNRLKKLVATKTRADRVKIAKEAQAHLDALYKALKINSKKLIDIDRVLRD